MKLIVGLGNPGRKYEGHRHNVGFMAVDQLARKLSVGSWNSRAQGQVCSAEIQGEKTLLVKPETFMNLSGRCVSELYRFHKCTPEDLIVIHDELDLSPYELKIKKGGGTGGHNGLKSIEECLGSDQNGYYRIRMGIGHPRNFAPHLDVADYVLQNFPSSESALLQRTLEDAEQAAILIAKGNANQAMNQFNRKPKPTTPV